MARKIKIKDADLTFPPDDNLETYSDCLGLDLEQFKDFKMNLNRELRTVLIDSNDGHRSEITKSLFEGFSKAELALIAEGFIYDKIQDKPSGESDFLEGMTTRSSASKEKTVFTEILKQILKK